MGLTSTLKRKVIVIDGPGIQAVTPGGVVAVHQVEQHIYVERFYVMHEFFTSLPDYDEGQPLEIGWDDIRQFQKVLMSTEALGENRDKAAVVIGEIEKWAEDKGRWHVRFGVATSNVDSDNVGFTSFEYVGG